MNALVRKLENYIDLSQAERAALMAATADTVRLSARSDLIRQGDRPGPVNLLLTGYAARYKTLEDGRRQVLAILIPGDFCDLRNFVLDQMDHSIATLTEVTVAQLTPEVIDDLTCGHPRLQRALWWAQLVDEAITREWVVNTGQRSALERSAHFLCELFWRVRAVGLTQGDTCEFPLTQIELSDTLGMSAVHVNRTLQEMRREGLIVLQDRQLAIPDLQALESAGLFDPTYLHLRSAEPQAGRTRQSA